MRSNETMKAADSRSVGGSSAHTVKDWFIRNTLVDSVTIEDRTGLVWACVIRNETVLAGAPGDENDVPPEARDTARELLSRKPVVGWDFCGSYVWRACYRGVKFHVYEDNEDELRIWTFACIYDSKYMTKRGAQLFIEQNMVAMTQVVRDVNDSWKYGGFHACQEEFAPILLQRMQEVNTKGGKRVFRRQSRTSTTGQCKGLVHPDYSR